MNRRTSKLLKRYARCTNSSLRSEKRRWNRLSHTERPKNRNRMEQTIANY